MIRFMTLSFACWIASIALSDAASAQSGLRESLERLDRNHDGSIDPSEITSLSRPYLERVADARRMSLDRPNRIEAWQEAARIYYALKNGVAEKRVVPNSQSTVVEFGPQKNDPLVPEFGLPEIKYPYIQEDLDEADATLKRTDLNRDGYIDREEAQRDLWTHRDPFEEDYDRDNRLSRLELSQRYARRRLLSGASSELIQKARRVGSGIRPADTNSQDSDNNRRWDRDRSSRYYLTSSVLERFDLNRSGRLEEAEAIELGLPVGRIDVDRDGELSRQELTAYLTELQDEAGDISEGLPGWFYERDTNHDEQVAMDEFATEWSDEKAAEFQKLDANQDGLLTISEAIQAKSLVGGDYSNRTALVLPPRKTVISEIVIDEDFVLADVNIQLSITHTHAGDLDGHLTGPSGQRIELFAAVGGNDDHFDRTIFDDEAPYPIVKARPPFQGTFSPGALIKHQPSLSSLKGQSVKGTWQLVINGARSDRFGMLHGWSLIVEPVR